MDVATKRLSAELRLLLKDPPPNIEAYPHPDNILEWHYVIHGPTGTPYEGGFYHGTLRFPPTYPMQPPSISMVTPNGRFKPSTRLCLSMSDYHPEMWNPMWSVSSILTGLLSFMLEDTPTAGSMDSTQTEKIQFAQDSLVFNSKDKIFKMLFPHLVPKVSKSNTQKHKKAPLSSNSDTVTTPTQGTTTTAPTNGVLPLQQTHSCRIPIFVGLCVLLVVVFLVFLFYTH
ncbi:Ubiquitinconjugating enzyme subfamily protein [Pelomyxa schiedti]|nr:Ubiquitinconjugating enzyme subfamily protein [Pelomyxa schiedti]